MNLMDGPNLMNDHRTSLLEANRGTASPDDIENVSARTGQAPSMPSNLISPGNLNGNGNNN